MERKEISKAVLKRLPGYLSYLKGIPADASPYISATALAAALGMGEVQVRKDLAMVSDGGRPKIGYLRESLIEDISQFLGYDNTTDAILVGAGKLGQARNLPKRPILYTIMEPHLSQGTSLSSSFTSTFSICSSATESICSNGG